MVSTIHQALGIVTNLTLYSSHGTHSLVRVYREISQMENYFIRYESAIVNPSLLPETFL